MRLMPNPTSPASARQQAACFSGRPAAAGAASRQRALQPGPCPRRRTPAATRQPLALAALASDDYDDDAGGPAGRFDDRFLYMSPETLARLEAELEAARLLGLEEYEELKALLLKRTWRFGTFFALYLLLTVSAEAALAELVGSALGYGYFKLLTQDIDRVTGEDRVYMREAAAVPGKLSGGLACGVAGLRHAAQPRLLVLVGMFAAWAAFNAAFPDDPLTRLEEGCMVGGFLSYKVALILKIYDDNKPRALSEEELLRGAPPMLPVVEDVKLAIKRPSQQAAERAAAAEAAAAGEGEGEGAAAAGPGGQAQS